MRLSILDRGVDLTDELRNLMERRLLFALARFDARIRRVTAVATHREDPQRGRQPSRCITVRLKSDIDIVTTHQEPDMATCIIRTAARAGRAVARAVKGLPNHQHPGCPGRREG